MKQLPEQTSRSEARPEHFWRVMAPAHPWLRALHDAYGIVNASVSAALTLHPGRMACAAGCAWCCMQPIPVMPLEVAAIRLYKTWAGHAPVAPSDSSDPVNQARPLTNEPYLSGTSLTCPMLVNGLCSVYEVRPMACRRFIVMNSPCAEGECVTDARPGDVLGPSRKAFMRALGLLRPVYEQTPLWREEFANPESMLRALTTTMQSVEWR